MRRACAQLGGWLLVPDLPAAIAARAGGLEGAGHEGRSRSEEHRHGYIVIGRFDDVAEAQRVIHAFAEHGV